jgi:hypothetical protein
MSLRLFSLAHASLTMAVCALSGPALAQSAPERIPAEIQGRWGATCSEPQARFATDFVTFNDNRPRYVSKVNRKGSELELTYRTGPNANQEITDVFGIEGNRVRHLKTITAGVTATFDKAAWEKCASVPSASGTPLSLNTIRFPADQPSVAQDSAGEGLAKSVSSAVRQPCETRKVWTWPSKGWERNKAGTVVRGISDELRKQGNSVRALEGPKGTIVARVEPTGLRPVEGETPLLIAFQTGNDQLTMVACTTK